MAKKNKNYDACKKNYDACKVAIDKANFFLLSLISAPLPLQDLLLHF